MGAAEQQGTKSKNQVGAGKHLTNIREDITLYCIVLDYMPFCSIRFNSVLS